MTAWSRPRIFSSMKEAGVRGDTIAYLRGLPTKELREICLESTDSEDFVLDLDTLNLIQRDLSNIIRAEAHAEVL